MEVTSPKEFPIRGESEPWCAAWLSELAGEWAHPHAQPEYRPETCLWKDVREYLEHCYDPEYYNTRVPMALCPSCMCELDIIGLSPANGASPEATGRPRAVVTVCGHMACEGCLDMWYRSCLDAGHAVCCPICRHQQQFTAADCRHPIGTWRLPGHDPRLGDVSSYLDSGCQPIPRTLPEGGTQSVRCRQCRERRVVELMSEFDQHLDTHLFLSAGQDIVREANLILEAWVAAKVDVMLIRLPALVDAEQAGWGEQWESGRAEGA
ncbi:hypothetical protein C8A05DRAFT_32884 [Staphylotrichum tortipilum]|uniref:RING-type domain-containing protein n=1 Tax=Staphylotrichum tortipilum TaxID=2831512 RepID=A0AAN6MLZ7_9PEZI|nr:hypothetical protein C8A05DRAFT_32884 [Staphylotrichum longicolle]